jgi:hypothetical protein
MEAFLLEASGSGRGDITGVGTETEGEECELPPTGCTPEGKRPSKGVLTAGFHESTFGQNLKI